VIEPQKPDAAHLDQTGKRFSGTYKQSSTRGFEKDAVIGDKFGEAHKASARCLNESERKPGFP
jgi:hypothetical protein